MQSMMGGSLTYVHENGMNFNRITDDIIVGSCLQVADDADRCASSVGFGALSVSSSISNQTVVPECTS